MSVINGRERFALDLLTLLKFVALLFFSVRLWWPLLLPLPLCGKSQIVCKIIDYERREKVIRIVLDLNILILVYFRCFCVSFRPYEVKMKKKIVVKYMLSCGILTVLWCAHFFFIYIYIWCIGHENTLKSRDAKQMKQMRAVNKWKWKRND